jgi:WD40 repeat protein
VNAVAFNAVGDRLVSAEASGNAHLWDLAAGKDILTLRAASEGPLTGASLPHYSNAALSHRVALAGASGVVRIYNLDLESLRDEATELVKRQQPSFTKEECGSYFRRAGCAALPSGRWAYFFFAR